MRKRRVGVTAGSRLTDTDQATGMSQVATEMAAPLCIENTKGHRGEGRKQSADGSMATNAQTAIGGAQLDEEPQARQESEGEGGGALRAHEALPHAPPGGKPPETPGPLSLEHRWYARERICQGFAAPAQSAALDRFAPLRGDRLRGGKGGLRQSGQNPASRWSAAESPARCARHEALPHTSPGGKPPETPLGPGGTFFP